MKETDNKPTQELDKPPFFKSWKSMYWLVLGNLAFLITLFYIITRIYS
ncbi:hypothetical protein K3G39_18580 [Pontibacter sp. HSC-14F20]|nr:MULTISPECIES: hypothetical protein [unclassified Pontibacter]MBX0335245.1 hypothetical protein [Pontibacter sp. HSC-14F20]MCP2043635.1 hypothetical protein [Pontibacter sp. HSC-36F09]